MRSRSFVAVALTIVCLLGGSAAVLAYDSSQRDKLAAGITIGGVEVGGLSAAQARVRLRAAIGPRLHRTLVLRYGARRFVLTAAAARVRFDFAGAVDQALRRSRADNLVVRVVRSMTGGSVHARFEPQVRFSSRALARFTSVIAGAIGQPARSASVSFTGSAVAALPARRGLAVRTAQLQNRIKAALADASAPSALQVPVTRTTPQVSTETLAVRYPTIITVDRSAFTLRLWKRLRLVSSYRIAVGMAGLETPAGLYHVQDKQVDPSWHVPDSAWAGSLAGQTIPPGPADPIKARWMGIYNGAGIHGTEELSSLGSAASHGCIRMAIPDVIKLYSQTPLGTPVYIT
ncbi:MAG: L,D-transpeptidase ErfK/SrfK [Solirubrobacteraceae bacterium]|nr:L,D-transpeptidase ErfK/SrfK [Solirubrobacteraceae bacterium]